MPLLTGPVDLKGGLYTPAYTAAKHAVAGLTKSLSNEWARHGVQVNAVGPGYIRSDLTATLEKDPVRSRQINERIPAGRWGEPDDFKGVIVFLASQASAYVCGETIVVDGVSDHQLSLTSRTHSLGRGGCRDERCFADQQSMIQTKCKQQTRFPQASGSGPSYSGLESISSKSSIDMDRLRCIGRLKIASSLKTCSAIDAADCRRAIGCEGVACSLITSGETLGGWARMLPCSSGDTFDGAWLCDIEAEGPTCTRGDESGCASAADEPGVGLGT